jgi:hypothetical protein
MLDSVNSFYFGTELLARRFKDQPVIFLNMSELDEVPYLRPHEAISAPYEKDSNYPALVVAAAGASTGPWGNRSSTDAGSTVPDAWRS